MNDYREMKRDIASRYNIPYLDIRKAFLDEIARHKPVLYCGYLTYDGEHENQRGTDLLAELFAHAIAGWLKNRK